MQVGNKRNWITSRDRNRSATVHMLDDLFHSLQPMRGTEKRRMLDIGCGFGGLAKLVSAHLNIPEAHGIDLDSDALKEAREKGIVTHHLDVDHGRLPFPDGYFDLVISFGMLDYLPFFDHCICEISRVTRRGGHVLVSLPNLASWHNRLFLLLGYQPRDVEVSRELLLGVHPWYRKDDKPTGHIHTVTVPAFRELMAYHGFEMVRITGARPGGRKKNLLLNFADFLFSRRPTLARRFFYLGTKPQANDGSRTPG